MQTSFTYPVSAYYRMPPIGWKVNVQSILRGCRVTSRREINLARKRRNTVKFRDKANEKISITAVKSNEVLGINRVARDPMS